MNKLNCGCGTDIKADWMNLDIRPLPGVDVVCDMSKGIPLDDNVIDELLAQDILEHFPLDDTKAILNEWYRILKPGGTITVEVPNFMMSFKEWQNNILPTLSPEQSQTERFSQYIFGRQDYPGNFHYQMFDEARLQQVLQTAGFINVDIYHRIRALGARASK